MRYAVIVIVDSDDSPQEILDEILSTLEFDHRSTVQSVVVFNDDGEELAAHNHKEKMP